MSDVKVTLAHKKNIKDLEPKKAETLAKIKAITGVDYEFTTQPSIEEMTLAALQINSSSRSFAQTPGEVLYGANGYLDKVRALFEKSCKDEMIKEALIDATKGKKIVLQFKDGCGEINANTGGIVNFENGVMFVYTCAKNFGYYCSKISDEVDVAKLL